MRVVFLKDYPQLPTPMGVVSVKRGDELELPRWQARILKNMGFAEIRDSEVDLNTINTFHFRERRNPPGELVAFQQDFYLRAREFIEKIDRIIRENPSHMLLRDRDSAEKNLVDIAETRLLKLLKLAYSQDAGVKTRITVEELVLYDYLLRAVSSWRSYIKKIVGGAGSG
ncbi:MAG: GINS complex subunit Sld5 [Acidilobaceae archaeon]